MEMVSLGRHRNRSSTDLRTNTAAQRTLRGPSLALRNLRHAPRLPLRNRIRSSSLVPLLPRTHSITLSIIRSRRTK